MRRQFIIIEIISSLLILLFVYTGINKLISINTLKSVLKDYPLIGNIPWLFAWALPITELIVALLLFLPRTRLWGLYASLVLLSSFSLYLSYMLIFTSKLPCTCGGMLEKLTWPQHFIVNMFFILLSLAGILLILKSTKKQKIKLQQAIFT